MLRKLVFMLFIISVAAVFSISLFAAASHAAEEGATCGAHATYDKEADKCYCDDGYAPSDVNNDCVPEKEETAEEPQTPEAEEKKVSENTVRGKVAVVDIINTSYKGFDKFYGDGDAMRSNVANLIGMGLELVEGLEAAPYIELRTDLAGKSGADPGKMTVEESQALDFAARNGCEFLVLGNVTEAKVKTSKSKLFSPSSLVLGTKKKKYSPWVKMGLSLYRVADQKLLFKRDYESHHQFSDKKEDAYFIYFKVHGDYYPNLLKWDSDPTIFGGSDYGLSFLRVIGQFNIDVAKELGMTVKNPEKQ